MNSKGGVEGHKIKALEIDHEYKVPPAVESYERHKKEGAVTMAVYGTPHDLCARREADGGPHPGHLAGLRQRRRRRRHPVPLHLPHRRHLLVAGHGRRWTSSKKQLGGSLKGKKIAFIFYDNPAGREPIEVLEDLATMEGFHAQDRSRCRLPASRWAPRCSTSRSASARDFVIAHLFGGAPAVSIKEFKRVGYPLQQGRVVRVGLGRGQHRRGRRLRRRRGLLHDAVRRRGHRTTRC